MTNKLSMVWTGALLLACTFSSYASEYRFNYTLSSAVPIEWQSYDPIVGEWEDKGDIYGCSNWSPSSSSVGNGVRFSQEANDCIRDQIRTIIPRLIDPRTENIKSLQNQSYVETRKNPQRFTQSRDAVGILQSWYAIDPIYSPWVITRELYGCSTWTPDPSTYHESSSFSQISDCTSDESRMKQVMEQESFSGEKRADGLPSEEVRSIQNQPATRLYTVNVGEWQDVGQAHACSDWTPDPSTIDKGLEFNQSQNGCLQDQKRTRDEFFIDHVTKEKVTLEAKDELQVTAIPTKTRSSIGTKVPPVCIFNDIFTSGHRSYVVSVKMTDSSNRNTLLWYYDGAELPSTNNTYENYVNGVRYVPGKVIRVSYDIAWQVQTYYEACKESQ